MKTRLRQGKIKIWDKKKKKKEKDEREKKKRLREGKIKIWDKKRIGDGNSEIWYFKYKISEDIAIQLEKRQPQLPYPQPMSKDC